MKYKIGVLINLISILVASNIFAGEYGIIINDNTANECAFDRNKSLNTCTSEAVVKDLNDYFLNGQKLAIKANYYMINGCNVLIKENIEIEKLCGGLASIIATDNVKHIKELKSIIRCLPYKSMTDALKVELKSNKHSILIENRIKEAMLSRNKK